MRFSMLHGLGVLGCVLVANGCADPCSDDGLAQSDASECPAQASQSESDTQIAGETDTDADSMSASNSQSDSANSDSNSNSNSDSETDSNSNSDSETESNTNSDSDTDSSTESNTNTDSDTDSSTESNTNTDSDTDSATDTESDSDTDSATDTESESDSDTSPSTPYCEDNDEDGFGDPDACTDVPDGEDPPDGTVPNDDDCDDDSANTFPGAAEEDSATECMADEDDDGWGDDDPGAGITPGSDCDDGDLNTFPGAAELDSTTECMQDEDDDGWGDDDPADGVTAGSDCSDDGVDPCAVLVTQDGTANDAYDQGLIAALVADGYEVLNFADTDVVLADGNGVDVVVISETALSTEINDTLRNTPAPMVCLEGLIWDDNSMAAEPATTGNDDVTLVDMGPLAGGLAGTVTVMTGPGSGLFTTPAPAGATVIATVSGGEDAVEFVYDTGTTMLDGFDAPNRRVGLGFDADQSATPNATITPDGITLFRAAVAWATSG